LILSNAVLNGSPVPSLALDPMLMVCLAIGVNLLVCRYI
jgi:hypothetical protein